MGSGHGLIYGSTARTRSLLSLRLTAIFLTLTVVTQPGFRPACEAAAYFKDHYLYDPSRAFPALSKKAREHLRRAEQSCAFDVVTRFDERMTIAGLYEELRRRRGLAGTFFDFPRIHFETVARLDGAVFFRVRNGHDVCAMACGFAFGDWIQLLHIAITDAGLRQDASYCLMNASSNSRGANAGYCAWGACRAMATRGSSASRRAGRTGRSQSSCSGSSTIAPPMPSSFAGEKTSAISPPIVPQEDCSACRLSAPRLAKQR